MLNKKTFIISILIVFITIIGVSYAFFSSNVIGTGKDNIVSAGSLSLHFEDGDEMTISDAYPGDKIEKIFTITNTGTLTTSYTMWWKDLTNTYINDELVMSLECNSYKILDGEKTKFGSCENLEETVIGTESKVPIKSNIQIEDGIIHEYKLTVLFKEMNKLQNYNMNKTFTGTINIKEYFENETDAPVIEYYSFTNKILTLKANDSIAITHYALSYGEEDVAALFNTKSKLIMKMNTNDLQWTKVEETNVLQIETPIEDYNVTVHIKNKIGNILSQDLTPKPVVIVNPNGGTWNDSTGEQTYNMTYDEYCKFVDFILRATSLKLIYVPKKTIRTEYYRDIDLFKIDKSEEDEYNVLPCPIMMNCKSLWYEQKNIVLTVGEEEGEIRWDFEWDSRFADYTTRSLLFENKGHTEAPIKLEIEGYVKNPSIFIYKNGELTGSLELTLELQENEKLIYCTKDTELLIKKQNADGTEENLFDLLSPNFINFIKLNKGINQVKLLAEEDITKAKITIYEEYKAV